MSMFMGKKTMLTICVCCAVIATVCGVWFAKSSAVISALLRTSLCIEYILPWSVTTVMMSLKCEKLWKDIKKYFMVTVDCHRCLWMMQIDIWPFHTCSRPHVFYWLSSIMNQILNLRAFFQIVLTWLFHTIQLTTEIFAFTYVNYHMIHIACFQHSA